MSYIEKAHFLPMPEAPYTASMGLTLQLLEGGISAYKIPSPTGEIPSIFLHDHAVCAVAKDLEQLFPGSDPDCDTLDFTGLGQDEIGLLHHDMEATNTDPFDISTRPFVHTTLTGGGRAFIADMGPMPDLADDFMSIENLPLPKDHPDTPHNLLLRGLVDTRVMSRVVRTTILKPGDSVVVVEGGRRCAWHRFDTDRTLGERVIRHTTITDLEEGVVSGFDLQPIESYDPRKPNPWF